MQFTRDAGGMDDAKKYLLEKIFGEVPAVLEFKQLHEVLELLEASAKKSGKQLGMFVKVDTESNLKAAHYFLVDMIQSKAGQERNVDNEYHGANTAYGNKYGAIDIESSMLDTLADYYKGKVAISDFEELTKAPPEAPQTYLQMATASRREALNSVATGMRVVLGDDFAPRSLVYNDAEALKTIHKLTLEAGAKTGMYKNIPTNKKTFENRLANPDERGVSGQTGNIAFGILIAFAVKAQRGGVSIDSVIDEAVKDGKIVLDKALPAAGKPAEAKPVGEMSAKDKLIELDKTARAEQSEIATDRDVIDNRTIVMKVVEQLSQANGMQIHSMRFSAGKKRTEEQNPHLMMMGIDFTPAGRPSLEINFSDDTAVTPELVQKFEELVGKDNVAHLRKNNSISVSGSPLGTIERLKQSAPQRVEEARMQLSGYLGR